MPRIRSEPGIVALVLAATAAVYLSTAGGRAVLDYDEGHYAEVALQMVERHDWVTPYNNGVRFLEKPPLMYWASAASLRFLGINEFALRMPTAIAVLGLVCVTMRMAQRTAGPRAAAIAGVCTGGSVGTVLFTRETLHDVWLVLFLTLALWSFLEWYLDPQRRLRYALAFYASLAGAFMTKSLIGVAFPIGAILVFFLLGRERPGWCSLHLLPGLSLFLVLSVPWHWLVAVRNEGFLWSFFVNEQFLRFFGRHDPPVVWSVPLVLFWALLPVWFFPWTAFLPAAISCTRSLEDESQRVLVRLAAAWFIVVLGFYSVSARLEHYAFPLLPVLALLVGLALGRRDGARSIGWGFRALAIFGITALAAGAAAGLFFYASGQGFKAVETVRAGTASETDFSVLGSIPAVLQVRLLKPAGVTLLAMAVGFWIAARYEARRRRMAAVLTVAAVMVVICGMIQWSLVICDGMVSSRVFGLAVAREAKVGDHLVVVGDLESANSVSFYQPLHVEVVDGVAYSLIPGMKYPDAPRIVLTDSEFRGLWRSASRVYALVPSARLAEMNLGGVVVLGVLDRVLVRNR